MSTDAPRAKLHAPVRITPPQARVIRLVAGENVVVPMASGNYFTYDPAQETMVRLHHKVIEALLNRDLLGRAESGAIFATTAGIASLERYDARTEVSR